jgi:F-type H+-transporting ATPase subunit delta
VIDLGGNSRQSFAALRGELDQKLFGLSSQDCTAISAELFTVLFSLNSSVGLRRACTDPSRDAASKAVLINDLFGKNVSRKVLDILIEAVSLRWASSVDFASAFEQLAIEAEATAANNDNTIDRVQDELFEFAGVLSDNQDLRRILGGLSGSPAGKADIIHSLLADKVAPSTLRLLTYMVNDLAGRVIDQVLEVYAQAVAARRNRLIVLVRTRSALSPSQAEKLSALMIEQVGQPVHLNFELDPSVIGGVSVRFADELVDGTISTRLQEAGRALAI